jgi:hypothetical protein
MPLTFQSGEDISKGVYTPVGAPMDVAPMPFDGYGSPQERAAARQVSEALQQSTQQQIANRQALAELQGMGMFGYGPQEVTIPPGLADISRRIGTQEQMSPITRGLLSAGGLGFVSALPTLSSMTNRQIQRGLLEGGMPVFSDGDRVAGVLTEGLFPGTTVYVGQKIPGYEGPFSELVRERDTTGDDDEQPTRPQCPPGFVYDENIQACVPAPSATTAAFDVNAPLVNRPTYQAGSLLGTTPMGVL